MVLLMLLNKQKLKDIQQNKKKWEKEIALKSLEKLPEKGEFLTSSEIPVNRVYTPIDVADFDYLQDLGFPGEYPFIRGVYPTMYRARLWLSLIHI